MFPAEENKMSEWRMAGVRRRSLFACGTANPIFATAGNVFPPADIFSALIGRRLKIFGEATDLHL